MRAFNVVKFRVKSGSEGAFLDAHRDGKAKWPGLVSGSIIKTGDASYCLIGEWASADALAAARPAMIATLDTFRATLDEVAEGRGITDAVSGAVVLEIA
ncbi:MAG: DUF718 domain-containing protein [Beijerinckiaceae bacterium]